MRMDFSISINIPLKKKAKVKPGKEDSYIIKKIFFPPLLPFSTLDINVI